MNVLLVAVAVAAAMIIFFRAFAASKRTPAVVVAFVGGRVEVRHGAPPRRFVSDCRELLRMWRDGVFPDGEVKVYEDPDGDRVSFSESVPEEWHQRFRNAWFAHCEER